jgi:hypothetical protein
LFLLIVTHSHTRLSFFENKKIFSKKLEGNSPEKRSARTQQKRKLCKPKIKSPLTGTQSKKTRKKNDRNNH